MAGLPIMFTLLPVAAAGRCITLIPLEVLRLYKDPLMDLIAVVAGARRTHRLNRWRLPPGPRLPRRHTHLQLGGNKRHGICGMGNHRFPVPELALLSAAGYLLAGIRRELG